MTYKKPYRKPYRKTHKKPYRKSHRKPHRKSHRKGSSVYSNYKTQKNSDRLSNYSSSNRKSMQSKKRRSELEKLELAILRKAQDEAEERMGEKVAQSPDVIKIIKILESFLIKHKLICYGGTAINNILPVEDQFYNKDIEVPDYDFFSPKALQHAKELADVYKKEGYTDIVAQSGVHVGTYKVFVNFIPVADITQLPNALFNAIKKEAITVNRILYAPPNYLRMAMYLELSRPDGDVSR